MTEGGKIRILFVDDEPAILGGLRNRLHRLRSAFEMTFVEGGPAAVETLAVSTFDVVVTDLKMPIIDGTEVLRRTQALDPHALRIVLSGHADLESVLRVVPVAHRYLAKPCDPDELQRVIERARALRSIVGNDRVLAHDSFALVDAVHVAEALVAECTDGVPRIDMDWLARIGVSGRMEEWRKHAAVIVNREAA